MLQLLNRNPRYVSYLRTIAASTAHSEVSHYNVPQVVVETIALGCEEEEEEEEDEEESEDDGWGDDEGFDDFDDNEEGTGRKKKPRIKAAKRPLSRRRPRQKKSSAAAAATVSMRHPASGTVMSWRTAGVKDTTGSELHEGTSYRLVATVRDVVPGAAGRAGAIGVTRCRLTLVTPDSGGSR